MAWNYRIMHYRDEHPDYGHPFGIHEVFYAEDGAVKGWTEDAIALVGHNLDDLEWRLRAMLEAFQRPVLEYDQDQPNGKPTSPEPE